MFEASPLIATLVVGIGLAFVFGAIAHRLRLAPILGYLVAGVVVGPFTPGIVADQELAAQLADVGVILLMFGVGLHFSLNDLISVRRIAVPGALTQMFVVAGLGTLVGWFFGFTIGGGIVYGLSLSVTSTVVLTRSLQDRHLMETERGHIAVGWAIVQDIATVLALVLLPPLASVLNGGNVALASLNPLDLLGALARTFGTFSVFVIVLFMAGRHLIPAILHYTAHTGSRELFRLAVLSIALGVAFLASELFGVSFALGAFFAGMFLKESELSQRAAEESLPFRDAFAVLFFVSVGMLFNPLVLLNEAVPLFVTLTLVLVVSGGTVFMMVRALGRPVGDALLIAAGLAQIGEFAFILSGLGIALDVLPVAARDLILGTSILSIFANPLLFTLADRLRARYAPAPVPAAHAPAELLPTELRGHAVLVGYGRVGQLVGEALRQEGWPLLVIEDATDIIERLSAEGVEVLPGNAADDRVLMAANLKDAKLLLVAIPNGFEAGQIVEQARAANPDIDIVARAHFDAEVEYLSKLGANVVIMGEREIARSMKEYAAVKRKSAAASAEGESFPVARDVPVKPTRQTPVSEVSADSAPLRIAP
jgi:CPA2 family monovalent cation:H+ antiporter-2